MAEIRIVVKNAKSVEPIIPSLALESGIIKFKEWEPDDKVAQDGVHWGVNNRSNSNNVYWLDSEFYSWTER